MLDTVLLLKFKLMYLKILNTKKKITPIIDKESTQTACGVVTGKGCARSLVVVVSGGALSFGVIIM